MPDVTRFDVPCTDRAAVAELFGRLFAEAGLPAPQIVYTANPVEYNMVSNMAVYFITAYCDKNKFIPIIFPTDIDGQGFLRKTRDDPIKEAVRKIFLSEPGFRQGTKSDPIYSTKANSIVEYNLKCGMNITHEKLRTVAMKCSEEIFEKTFGFYIIMNTVVVCEYPKFFYLDSNSLLNSPETGRAAYQYNVDDSQNYLRIFWKGEKILPVIEEYHHSLSFYIRVFLAHNFSQERIDAHIDYMGGMHSVIYNGRNLNVVLDKDANPEHGKLIMVRISGFDHAKFLVAECPRNGTICERVPFEVNTVKAAQAWRVGMTEEEFEYPAKRT